MSKFKGGLAALACIGVLSSGPVSAEASGPDFYRVVGVSEGSFLNMRALPSMDGAQIATVPADADGIANLGCIGGLTLPEFEAATEAERAAGRMTRWCRVGYDRTIGWVAGWFLGESTSGQDQFRAGGILTSIAGTEWGLRDFAGIPPGAEAWISFKSDNSVSGNGGCNGFSGSYTLGLEGPVFSPLVSTRMLCPQPQMATEARLLEVLAATQRIVSHNLVMAMFGGDNALLATFVRRDAD